MTAAPLTVYKLMVLYMLNRLKEPIAKERVSAFLLENGYAGFVSLIQTYAELEERGLVRTENTRDKEFLIITEEGRESLFYFGRELSPDIRKQIESFLTEKGLELINDHSLKADYDRTPDGLYLVRLAVWENNHPVVDLTLSVPDLETARAACSSWKEKNEEIYSAIIEKLF
jgi:predicted transcriptional regulator